MLREISFHCKRVQLIFIIKYNTSKIQILLIKLKRSFQRKHHLFKFMLNYIKNVR